MTLAAAAKPSSGRYRSPEVVKSAVRALQILEFFDRWREPAAIGVIAADLGYPQSSTSALIRSLVKVGYLTYDPRERTYMPTERVPLLGSWIDGAFLRDGPVLAAARRIAERSGHAVALGRRNGVQVQWMHVVPSPQVSAQAVFASAPSLAHSAVGQALLSVLDDRQLQGLMHRLNGETQDLAKIIRPADMLAKARDIRRDGYVHLRSGDQAMLAMLIPTRRRDQPIAMAMIGKARHIEPDLQTLLDIMRQDIADIAELPEMRAPWPEFQRPANQSAQVCDAWNNKLVAAND